MNVTGPSLAPRGSKLTLNVTRARRMVGTAISLGGVTASVTAKSDGTTVVCFRLPASHKGIIDITLSDERTSDTLKVFVL